MYVCVWCVVWCCVCGVCVCVCLYFFSISSQYIHIFNSFSVCFFFISRLAFIAVVIALKQPAEELHHPEQISKWILPVPAELIPEQYLHLQTVATVSERGWAISQNHPRSRLCKCKAS